MIIIQVAGGLGNQLQQYALYRKFVHLGVEARLDLSWFDETKTKNKRKTGEATERKLELDYFDGLVYKTCTRREKAGLIGSEGLFGKLRRNLLPFSVHRFAESGMYHSQLFGFENMYISGYFACEKYYADILYDLREKIRFPQSANPANRELAQEMENCESVSVHVRRGDYLNPENAEMFGGICTEEYYEGALGMIRESCSQPRFYVFSDDIAYAQKQFAGSEYTIVDVNHGRDSFYDMWLMSRCRHNICANSTFSFWGARLNPRADKRMIRPAVHKNSQIFVKEEMETLWPGWEFVDNKGKQR